VTLNSAPAARQTTAAAPVNGAALTNAAAHTNKDRLKPFSPEWWARENAVDAQLRKSLIICKDCM
jgi:hypothetical protein